MKTIGFRRWPALVLLAVSLGCGLNYSATPSTPGFYSTSHRGKVPPELASEGDHWLNVPSPLALESLRGQVVWLEFSFLN